MRNQLKRIDELEEKIMQLLNSKKNPCDVFISFGEDESTLFIKEHYLIKGGIKEKNFTIPVNQLDLLLNGYGEETIVFDDRLTDQ